MNKIKIKDLAEYDGSWCKRNKDGFCDDFTMVDLKELLAQQKEKVEQSLAHKTKDGYCCACEYDIAVFEGKLKQQKEEIINEINKEYKKAEKMEGYDVKKAIVVMEVLNKIKEKL